MPNPPAPRRRGPPPRLVNGVLLAAVAIAFAWTALPGGVRLGSGPALATLDGLGIVTLDAEPVKPSALAAGRPLVLNLWASWCGPCRHEMPLLATAQAQRADVAFAFANQGEDPSVARGYVADSAPALRHVLLDPRRALGTAAGSRALPVTLLYDARGRLVDTHVGAFTPAALESALRRITSP